MAEDQAYKSLVDVSLDLDLPENGTLSAIRTAHVLAVVNVALANAVRHARARPVSIRARRLDVRLSLSVHDDGVGLPQQHAQGAVQPGGCL